MNVHPAAEWLPMMEELELQELAEDIRRNGLLESIVTLNGAILDGRNRYTACRIAGVTPRFAPWFGSVDMDPIAWVESKNVHRRHLTTPQRSMYAARKLAHYTAEARARQVAGVDLTRSSGEGAGEAADLAGAEMQVSGDSVVRASKVLSQGAPELIRAVERGLAVAPAAEVATLPPAEQTELVARGEKAIIEAAKRIRAERMEVRRGERMETVRGMATPNPSLLLPSRYPVVLADPPWRYEHAESDNRAIENQYPTMDLDAICALPVDALATEGAILFLWVPPPKSEEGHRVMREWGFTYRTQMVWVKDKIGMGYYARQRHELLFIGTRGAIPAPAPADRRDSVIVAPRTEHSAKPVEVYEAIERMYPTLPRIELFSRAHREGWAAWGNQAREAV